MSSSAQYSELADDVAQCGFVIRGGFHAQLADELPTGVASVVLVGNVGERGFDMFRRAPEWGTAPDPLDCFTERVLGALAQRCEARVVYPHQGPPWWPFQRWAMRAEAVSVSPLQILVHAQYGLWHAYRAALMFDVRVAGLPVTPAANPDPVGACAEAASQSPCAQCRSQPCLSACPVDAFDERGLNRSRCVEHLRSAAGRTCLREGCLARKACPVAAHSRYSTEQRQFHMRAFLMSFSDTPVLQSPEQES